MIVEVKTKKDLQDFLNLPFEIYRNNKYYVSPLLSQLKAFFSKNHPYRKHAEIRFFVSYKDGKPYGRISAQIDYDFIKSNSYTGHIGFFECVDDEGIASQLFHAAENFLKSNGIQKVIGPLSPSTHYTSGLLVDGFDEYPKIDMPYNMPYYEKLFLNNGYKKEMDLIAYSYRVKQEDYERLKKISEFVSKKYKIFVRCVNMKNFENEMEIIRDIYNDAWSENFGFTSIGKEEFLYITKELKSIAIPELVLIAYMESKPAGFIAAIPDFNQILKNLKGRLGLRGLIEFILKKNKIKTARVITMGVKKEFRKRGVDVALLSRIFENGIGLGFVEGELSWVLETNKEIRSIIEKFGAEVSKKYRLFSKGI